MLIASREENSKENHGQKTKNLLGIEKILIWTQRLFRVSDVKPTSLLPWKVELKYDWLSQPLQGTDTPKRAFLIRQREIGSHEEHNDIFL